METHANEEREDSIYTGTLPVAAGQTDSEQNADEEAQQAIERKKYHSSAMYAASKWHNTVSHVKSHTHRSLDL